MRTRSRGIVATLMILAVVAGASPPAHAERAGDSIKGDFNGDGLRDKAFLGTTEPDRCSVVVQLAQSPGVLLPPVAYTYLRPGGDAVGACPDIGTAFDWDGTIGDELWIGWSRGSPATVSYNRLVLEDSAFHPIATATSPVTPVYMGVADFSGDGRDAGYSYGRGGFAAFARDPTGGGEVSPVRWCTVTPPTDVTIRDFNRNGAMDVMMAYAQDCADGGGGVVVVLDDGTVRQLESSPPYRSDWTARIVYADDDRHVDIRTEDRVTGEVNHYIGIGGSFVRTPYTHADAVYPTAPSKVIIDVLDNDFATSQARVTIVTPPRYGTVQVLSDRRIAYTPTSTPARDDRFAYRLTENDRQSTTSVYVRFPD